GTAARDEAAPRGRSQAGARDGPDQRPAEQRGPDNAATLHATLVLHELADEQSTCRGPAASDPSRRSGCLRPSGSVTPGCATGVWRPGTDRARKRRRRSPDGSDATAQVDVRWTRSAARSRYRPRALPQLVGAFRLLARRWKVP